MSANSGTLNKNLLLQLECPVCFETCVPPIYMCTNGHSVCANCQPQLNECSTCRTPGKPTLRSVQLEKIAELVEMPCVNKPRGCRFSFNMADMANHLPKCEYAHECRVCKEWKGPAKDLKDHVSVVHVGHFVNLPSSGTRTIDAEFKSDVNAVMLFSFNDALFWLRFTYTLTERVFSCPMWLVSHSPREASRFYYSLEFPCFSSRRKVVYQGEVLNLTEDANRDHTDFMIPTGIIDSYKDRKITFTLSIVKE